MNQARATFHASPAAEPAQQVAQLCHVLALVERIAGLPAEDGSGVSESGTRINDSYRTAPAIVRRRFDTLAAETAAWAASAVEALVASRDAPAPPRAAAARLAAELQDAIRRMTGILAA